MKFYDALTDFIFTEQKPEKADAIFVPGGLYGEIAQHAAELYQQGFASLIVPSGKYSIVEGKFTEVQSPEKYKGRYFETESDFLTQILVDEFGVDAVINTGIAGSLNAQIDIGDIVISTDVLHHDMDAVNFGYAPGQIPQMEVFSFAADEPMAELAEKVCHQVNPEIKVFRGRVVSGDQFISDRATKDRITEQFHGFCTEMEGAAIAQAAYLNQIPFIVIRAISDKADDSASEDYPTFEKKAVEHSVRLVEGFLAAQA